jgi:hypothetical protein
MSGLMGEHETEVSLYHLSRFDKSNVFFSFFTCKGSEFATRICSCSWKL